MSKFRKKKRNQSGFWLCDSPDLCSAQYCIRSVPHKHNPYGDIKHEKSHYCLVADAFVSCKQLTVVEYAVVRLKGGIKDET